jgi:hypothetical protein
MSGEEVIMSTQVVKQIIAELDILQQHFGAVREIMLTLLSSDCLRHIPWIGQNTQRTDDDFSNSDCGAACVAMWLRSMGTIIDVDTVSRATGLRLGYSSAMPTHLITAAEVCGLKLKRVFQLTPDLIRAQISAGVPVIVLVHYGSLSQRFDQKFQAGHWLLVVGWLDVRFIYHDPYWPTSEQGSFLEMSQAELVKAMDDCLIDRNSQRQGLIMTTP